MKVIEFLALALLITTVTSSSEETELDPYKKALNFYLGEKIEQHDRIKEVYKRLRPMDWDRSDFNPKFDDPNSSSY